MTKNSRPILSVLIDEDKRTKFADLARRHSLSMGWLVNQAIDRMIEVDSIDIYRDSVMNVTPTAPRTIQEFSMSDIEKLITRSISDISTSSIDISDVEEIVRVSIENLHIPSVGIQDVQKIVNESIEIALEPIESEVEGLKKLWNSDKVVTATDSIAKIIKPTDYPAWVTPNTRRFFNKLENNPDLLSKVGEAIEKTNGNAALAVELQELGLCKNDGSPLDTGSISCIRDVVKNLKT